MFAQAHRNLGVLVAVTIKRVGKVEFCEQVAIHHDERLVRSLEKQRQETHCADGLFPVTECITVM